MGKMPSGDNESPKIGGTNEASNNSFTQGTEPSLGVDSIAPFPKAASNNHNSTNGAEKDSGETVSGGGSVLATKDTVIGGTYMGK